MCMSPWGWHEVSPSFSLTCAYSPPLCFSIGISQTTQKIACPILVTRSLQGYVWRCCGELCFLQYHLPWPCLAVGQWWSGEEYTFFCCTNLHLLASGTLIVVRYLDKILRAIVRPCWFSGPWVPPYVWQCLASCGQSVFLRRKFNWEPLRCNVSE